MKKKVLMGLALLVISGTSAIFAQQPTLDKLIFPANGTTNYTAMAKDRNISGEVVIPDTYNGKPVVNVGYFGGNLNITSVTLPNSLLSMANNAFAGCTNLTSVTFQASGDITIGNSPNVPRFTFDGDLLAKYQAGGAGTYTRTAGGTVWTKQGGFSLSGTWTRSDGMKITIADNGQNITITGDKPNNGGKLNDTYAKR